jgi:acetyl/propionyl-CoA carboxylase alpha subunit
MHGRVIAVPAAADERADAGKPLVVLEAMKMEHTLVLPVAARVTAVGVAVGDQVAAGSVLLRYEPVEGAAP